MDNTTSCNAVGGYPIVGIDIGKNKHYAAVLSPNSKSTNGANNTEIENTVSGRERFRSELRKLGKCAIAIEAVGGWASPLDYQLLDDGHKVFTIHPLRLARTRELYGQPQKTDVKDAQFLALLLKHAQEGIIPELAEKSIYEVLPMEPIYRQIKQFSRHYGRLSQDYTRTKNRLSQILSCYNPGLREVFASWDGKICLTLLSKAACPSQWKELSTRTLVSWIKAACRTKERARVKRLKKFVKKGNWQPLPEAVRIEVLHLASQLLQLKSQKEDVLTKMEQLLKITPEGQAIVTIPGCNVVLGATLVGELMPINRFPSHNQVAMYVGMTRVKHESGVMKKSKSAFVVNKKAKWAFRQLTLLNRQHFTLSQGYCQKKEKEGKTRHRANLNLGRQLVKVVHAMLKNKKPFDLAKVKEQ